jgi:quinolinate synthase
MKEQLNSADIPAEQIYRTLSERLGAIVPDAELRIKAELAHEINILKRDKNAVILGHNYMEAALFNSIPDFTGDSLALCREAAKTDKDIIVFCGVRFMAETAKILNPKKKVLIPSKKAGCSLAESITAEDVRNLKEKYPGVPVVVYVNTYADVKAESDISCTSGNAAQVVESLDSDAVIFLPDEYLARNVAAQTKKRIIFPSNTPRPSSDKEEALDYELIGWKGRCEVHEQFTVDDINRIRSQFPNVVVLSHPECSPEVVAASDFAGSTSAMIRFVRESNAEQYLVLTECAMGDNIAAENPDKEMLRLCSVRCPHMNEITMEDTLESLREEKYEVTLDEELRRRALRSVERMIAIG